MAERDQHKRWRCCVTGCNPKLYSLDAAHQHRQETGHRTAKWPIRSAEGKRRAAVRNKTGYYDKYNGGAKSAVARGLVPDIPATSSLGFLFDTREYTPYEEMDHPFSEDAIQP